MSGNAESVKTKPRFPGQVTRRLVIWATPGGHEGAFAISESDPFSSDPRAFSRLDFCSKDEAYEFFMKFLEEFGKEDVEMLRKEAIKLREQADNLEKRAAAS